MAQISCIKTEEADKVPHGYHIRPSKPTKLAQIDKEKKKKNKTMFGGFFREFSSDIFFLKFITV